MTLNNDDEDKTPSTTVREDEEDSSKRGAGGSINTGRENILSLMDSFIEQITAIRKTLLGVSISALILAPLAIGLSIYLLLHPSFFAILEIENEFGLVLSILLGAVLVISSIWLITGIRQYRSIISWSSRYNEYVKEKEQIDRRIASQYGLTMTDNQQQQQQD
ncbi:MAG TPA: hypothetical protein VIP70_05140 [Nitrososphaeraceae archaeon]